MQTFFKLLGAALALVLVFSLSAVVLAIAAVAGLIVWAWFWWQTRHVRRQMREQFKQFEQMQQAMQQGGGAAPEEAANGRGRVFDGEVVRPAETDSGRLLEGEVLPALSIRRRTGRGTCRQRSR